MSGHKIRSALTSVLLAHTHTEYSCSKYVCCVSSSSLRTESLVIFLFVCMSLRLTCSLSQTLHRDEPHICRVIESREWAQFYRAMTRTSGAGFYETSRCVVAMAVVMATGRCLCILIDLSRVGCSEYLRHWSRTCDSAAMNSRRAQLRTKLFGPYTYM